MLPGSPWPLRSCFILEASTEAVGEATAPNKDDMPINMGISWRYMGDTLGIIIRRICIYVYMYMYIYSMYTYVLYIYIYVYMCMHMSVTSNMMFDTFEALVIWYMEA